jgi:hypothetical protein
LFLLVDWESLFPNVTYSELAECVRWFVFTHEFFQDGLDTLLD